ncbi:ring finger protein-like [Hyla sarda]|uniref:ring finger protein-like n=1 Tax=Hyla sarda TaxID=327740 RepID=UPI0024C3943E|nr:ring finger protein-like [Hyla sarda]XP_056394408.1 ring finger protein-like [Hyla sarda]
MDEPPAACGDPITVEELRPSQDFAKMTRPKVTGGDIHGAKKAVEQSFELIEDLGGHLHAKDGPLDLKEREVLGAPCKVNMETLTIDSCVSHSTDSCVTISEDVEEEEDTSVVDHGSSQPTDSHGVDLLYGLPRTSSASGRSQVGDDEEREKKSGGHEDKELVESSKPLLEEDNPEQECPICTEIYDTIKHKQSLLNCNHIFCDKCIRTMVNNANCSNLCRLTCPICRQTTPMVEWEVRRMQEQMMESAGVCVEQDYVPPQPLVRRPGLCGALEYRFHKRFQTGRLFPLCIRNPQRLMERMTRLRHGCRCVYFLALVFLLFAEFFCFTFLFLPILVFILMIVLGK